MEEMLPDIGKGKDIFRQNLKSTENKSKTRHVGLHQTKKLLFNKETTE
jgi:hypothetical protein